MARGKKKTDKQEKEKGQTCLDDGKGVVVGGLGEEGVVCGGGGGWGGREWVRGRGGLASRAYFKLKVRCVAKVLLKCC
jgi:hypothetical protein